MFQKPCPVQTWALVTLPTPSILLVTLNRPNELNAVTRDGHHELDALFEWMDSEPSICVGVITGNGRAFCVGADLKEWNSLSPSKVRLAPPSGFAGLSRRIGRKPIIAAVNGLCLGGGFEIIVNCDLVLASPAAVFALPEVQRGLVPVAGSLPRLIRTVGRQRAMEMVLTGRTVSADEAERWGLVNRVLKADEDIVTESVKLAEMIARSSPDAILVSRRGLMFGWEGVGVEEGSQVLVDDWWSKIKDGENTREGLKAFVEKRVPNWKASKL
ncbi:enoyl-CoA hydratase [Halenospora varia]|nr:enoyl-CoA hydratase [Halenospora varia]